jgi:hypothetical protein
MTLKNRVSILSRKLNLISVVNDNAKPVGIIIRKKGLEKKLCTYLIRGSKEDSPASF